MDAEKRKIIVNEIHHWRRSKLLPEQYCDFLLNLYADDQGRAERIGPSVLRGGSTTASIRNSRGRVWIIGIAAAALLSYFVFHFSSFPVPMQIGSAACLLLICFVAGLAQKEKRPIISYLCLGAGAVLMLLVGVKLLEDYGLNDAKYIVGYLFLCSVTWLAVGWAVRSAIFAFCGWSGLILIYGWLLFGRLGEIGWLTAQASWLPLAAVMGWIGWLVQHRNKRSGLVFFVLALLLWFVPEAFLLYANGYSDAVQFSVTGKLLAAGLLAFVTRNKWTEWVA